MIRRIATAAAAAATVTMLLSGCIPAVPTGGTGQSPEPSTQETEMVDVAPVAEAVKAALPEFENIEVTVNLDGLTRGLMVDAEVPVGYVVTSDVLKSLLVAVWDSADPKPAFVKFNPWSTYEGQRGAIKAQRAAEELGIDWSPSFEVGVDVPDYEIKKLAGE